MKYLVLFLLLLGVPLHAQVVDSLVRYCPPATMDSSARKDTIVVVPPGYRLSLGQSIYLRAIQCGFGKVREVSKASGVAWVSSDTTIVKVTRTTGRITARKAGAVRITVTYP